MKLTRRTILASAVPALAAAQAPPASAGPNAAAPDYLAVSAAQYQKNAEALAKVAVPVETEPAFHFKP